MKEGKFTGLNEQMYMRANSLGQFQKLDIYGEFVESWRRGEIP
jgi:hypothetical protein